MISRSSQNFKVYAASVVLAADVTLTDAGELGTTSRSIYCEQAGVLVVTKLDGSTASVPFTAGAQIPLVVKGLVALGSTVKGIVVMG